MKQCKKVKNFLRLDFKNNHFFFKEIEYDKMNCPILRKVGNFKLHTTFGHKCILSENGSRTAKFRKINEDLYCIESFLIQKLFSSLFCLFLSI